MTDDDHARTSESDRRPSQAGEAGYLLYVLGLLGAALVLSLIVAVVLL